MTQRLPKDDAPRKAKTLTEGNGKGRHSRKASASQPFRSLSGPLAAETTSFLEDLDQLVRRHPWSVLLLAAGLGFLLAHAVIRR